MFCFLNLSFLLCYVFMYLRFREGLFCAYPISRKKKRIGFKNYWWFESHFQMGAIYRAYYVNKFFFLIWCLTFCVTLLCGVVSFLQPIVAILVGILGISLIPMSLWGMIKYNQRIYGVPIVIRRRTEIKGKFYSSIPEIILVFVFPFVFIFVDLVLMGVI